MSEHSFTIGAVLPADDLLAQFITVVAMISNDWQRLMADMENVEDDDQEGQRLLNYRLQAALHYEASDFLRKTASIKEVADFVRSLPEALQDDYRTVLSGLDPGIGHGNWFERNRQRTFHYSKLGPRAPIRKVLKRTARETGTITWGRRLGLRRFAFADQIALEWLAEQASREERTERMAISVMALARFTADAVGIYMQRHGVLP